MKRIGLLLFLIMPGRLLPEKAVLPPIYFSHVTLWVDPETYQAVRESDFLKSQFSAFETRTTQAEHGIVPTYTGTYLYRKRTYLEFIVAGSVPSQPTRVGELGVAMWVDGVQCLPAITASLVARTHASPHDLVFPNGQGKPDGHFLRKLKAIAKKAGVEGAELHRFRKIYADTLHEEGVSVNTIRIRLGHESLDVTLAYLKGKDAESEEAQEHANSSSLALYA